MAIFLGTLFIIICVLLIIVVLLQKGRGGGLGSAFGGAASSAFGTKVGDVFTWTTIVLVALFLLLAVGTTIWFKPKAGTVATPGFDPHPTQYVDYDNPVFVKIFCSTPDAVIYYTLDGSAPEKDAANSTLYESAVRVEPGTTLQARAYREGGWKPSRIAAGRYGPPLATQPAETTQPGATTRSVGEGLPLDSAAPPPAE
jgi:preprotein translocase subunit SecG